MRQPFLVGLPDSGLEAALAGHVASACRFSADEAGEIRTSSSTADAWGHGSALARTLLGHAPAARLLNAQIFAARGVTTPAAVAAAVDWLVLRGARLISMSFGQRTDREIVRTACLRALRSGVTLLAAAPARGAPVYPAAYPGVIRVTGDARCQPGEFSHLATAQADFGACPRRPDGGHGGASFAVAQVCGLLAASLMEDPGGGADPLDLLAQAARYHGPERRVG